MFAIFRQWIGWRRVIVACATGINAPEHQAGMDTNVIITLPDAVHQHLQDVRERGHCHAA